MDRLLTAFHETHRTRFSYPNLKASLGLGALGLLVTSLTPGMDIRRSDSVLELFTAQMRPRLLEGRWQPTALHCRSAIKDEISGSALIEGDSSDHPAERRLALCIGPGEHAGRVQDPSGIRWMTTSPCRT